MKQKSYLYIGAVCVLLGFFTVHAFSNQEAQTEIGEVASIRRIEELLNQKQVLEINKRALDERLREMEVLQETLESGYAQYNAEGQAIRGELQEMRMLAGLLPLEGPGVEIILNDRKRDQLLFTNPSLISYYIVHDSDLLNVINELRSAGAEAIAVNGTRIMANSRISCGGPTIHVGKLQRFAPPFIIHAIGDPNALTAVFDGPDSIYHDLTAWGLEFHVKRAAIVEIPRHLGDSEFIYARSIHESESR